MTANHKHTPTSRHIRKDDYTPSLEQMRDLYVRHADQLGIASNHVLHAEFERWLATIEAAAEQRGAERALTDFKRFAARIMSDKVNRSDVVGDIEVALKRLRKNGYLLMGPLHADQEGDDE